VNLDHLAVLRVLAHERVIDFHFAAQTRVVAAFLRVLGRRRGLAWRWRRRAQIGAHHDPSA
jgi:hypothetical protein